MSEGNLGDYGDIGDVDLFGLDEFGQPVGLNPMWGAVISGGLGTGAAIAARALSGPAMPGKFDFSKYSEGIGFGVAAVTSGLLIAFEGTRGAGWAGLATAFVTNGLRQLETLFAAPQALPAQTAGYGAAVVEPLDGVTIEPFRGLGVAVPEPVPPMYGAQLAGWAGGMHGPVAGPQISDAPPVDLMAPGALPPSSNHVEIMGGPALSGLGAHYGATLFGGSN